MPAPCRPARRQRFEADEQAAQPGASRELDRVVAQDRIDRRGALEHAVHAAHAGEEVSREPAVAEQVIVEEIEMPARQPRDFGQRIVDALRVKRSPAFEERVLVTERAVVRAAARYDDRVRHEIARALDQVAPDRRDVFDGPQARLIAALGRAGREVAQELREGVFAGPEEDRVGVRRRFVG